MPFEYQILGLMTVFFLFAWFPVSVGKLKTFGGRWLASNRVPVQGKELPPWAARCDRAYNNLKDYFPAFIVAVLVLGINGKFDESTKWVSAVYVAARIGHYIAYGLGSVKFRALFFFIGLFANSYLLIKIFI